MPKQKQTKKGEKRKRIHMSLFDEYCLTNICQTSLVLNMCRRLTGFFLSLSIYSLFIQFCRGAIKKKNLCETKRDFTREQSENLNDHLSYGSF